jgi:hypothetical protein
VIAACFHCSCTMLRRRRAVREMPVGEMASFWKVFAQF